MMYRVSPKLAIFRTPEGYLFRLKGLLEGSEAVGGAAGRGTAGPGTAGPGTAGPGTAGPGTVGPGTVGPSGAGATSFGINGFFKRNAATRARTLSHLHKIVTWRGAERAG